jgi:shikimate dehydrogenase
MTIPIQLVGLIGWPVEHSVSPAMHNAAFAALGLPWHYELLPTPPAGIEATLTRLKQDGYRGANVTVPHKEAVMAHMHEMTEMAQAIGAVNTIVVSRRRLIGDNTDGSGFLAALSEAGFDPTGQNVLVLGAGGAARAVVYSLAKARCSVTIFNRTAARAARLSRHMNKAGCGDRVVPVPSHVSLSETADRRFSLIVNATSVGMWPHTEASPWPDTLAFPRQCTVIDLVYNPPQTRLLAQARSAGVNTISGLGMLVHQGAVAFERWTGNTAPTDAMYAAAERSLTEMRGE